MIATLQTRAAQKCIHCVEFFRGADALVGWLGVHLDSASLVASSIAPAPIDFRFALNPTDRALVDRMLDQREADQLGRVKAWGSA